MQIQNIQAIHCSELEKILKFHWTELKSTQGEKENSYIFFPLTAEHYNTILREADLLYSSGQDITIYSNELKLIKYLREQLPLTAKVLIITD